MSRILINPPRAFISSSSTTETEGSSSTLSSVDSKSRVVGGHMCWNKGDNVDGVLDITAISLRPTKLNAQVKLNSGTAAQSKTCILAIVVPVVLLLSKYIVTSFSFFECWAWVVFVSPDFWKKYFNYSTVALVHIVRKWVTAYSTVL